MTADASVARGGVMQEGATVWKIARAGKAAVLVDGAAYFAALRSAMAAATKSVVVLGWDIDSRTPLVGPSGEAKDGAPVTFLPFLETLVERRPELDVRLLLWDYTLLYALDREPLPSLNLKWRTPPQVKVALDSRLPLGACHHQKIAVVDGTLAFCGGLDLTTRRWDTPEHRPRHPSRIDPGGNPYRPFHDMQMVVDGDAARALARICSERWNRATGKQLRIPAAPLAWPKEVMPDLTDVDVGIARTLPTDEQDAGVFEVLELYLAVIRRARRYIYIENQYLTSDEIAEALLSRMREMPRLELLLITPHAPEGWLEIRTMGAGQQRAMQKLSAEGIRERVRFLYPWAGGKGDTILVHAKMMIVDDEILRVGSSNLNNRSMRVDTECDLVIEARSESERAGIRSVLHRLLAEHLGCSAAEISLRFERGETLIEVAESGRNEQRGLEPLREQPRHQALAETLNLVADPEKPLQPSEFLGDMFGASPGNRFAVSRVLKLALVSVLLLVALLGWHYTPLAQLADPEELVGALYAVRSEWWIYPALAAAYVLGGVVLFPVTALIAITGMLLGPWAGWLTAMTGAMMSAWVGHATGRWLGGSSARHISTRAFRAVSRALKRQGVIAVAALRMVPVAPYTVVNMAMGAAGVSTRVFLAGSFIGMVPGTFVLTMLGDRLREAWRDPAPANLVLFALVIVLWLGLAFVLQQIVMRLRRRGR